MDKGSQAWNDHMYQQHPTPYQGIAGFIQQKRLQKIARIIRQYFPQQAATLTEIGCESGALLSYLQQQFPHFKYQGLDISPLALEQAREKLPTSVSLAQYDLCQEAHPAWESPDILVCSETLEHIPEIEIALQHLAEIASTDCLVILTVPIEIYKNKIKKLLDRVGLFDLLFSGIERELSEWHVHDLDKADFLHLVEPHFEVLAYDTIWYMHQVIVAKKKIGRAVS